MTCRGKLVARELLAVCLIPMIAFSASAETLKLDVRKGIPPAEIDNEAEAQERIEAVAGNASLISDEQWSDRSAATLKDVVQYVPGVLVQPRNGAESERLSIRGSGLANNFQGRGLLVLQDGVPLNETDGSFEFPAIDPWIIRYAEIYPGANGLEYGSSYFGGAINLVTPNGRTAPGQQVRSEVGSFGTFHEQLSVGRSWADGDIYAAASGYDQDGFRDNNAQQTRRFNANWGWQATPNVTNRLYFSYTNSDPEIPGTLSKATIADDPSQANPANRNGNYARDVAITRIADKLAWQEGANRADATVYYTYRTLDNPVTTYEFARNNDVGLRTRYAHDEGKNKWLTGVNIAYGDSDESRFQNLQATPGAPILTRDLYATTSEWFGQREQALGGPLVGIVGMQASYATRDIEQHTPNAREQDKDYAGISPRIGLRADLSPDLTVFSNLSRSFEPPSFGELSAGNVPGFRSLDAQRATTAELGARGREGTLQWSASYFHGWLKDEFVNYRFPDSSTATINVPRSKRDGVELGLNGDAARGLWVQEDAILMRVAYTYSHYTLDNDTLYGNNTIPGVPAHLVEAELLYRHPSGFSIGPNLEWVPKAYPVDLTNTYSSDAYAVLGARAAYAMPDRDVSFYIDARNLLDKSYIATANAIPDAAGVDGRYFYPGEGRAIYAGFKAGF